MPLLKSTAVALLLRGCWFIPASAGNTPKSRSVRRTSPVHPRICEEHGTFTSTADGLSGSSPHLRGTLFPEVTVI
jgi:hypothetical protein